MLTRDPATNKLDSLFQEGGKKQLEYETLISFLLCVPRNKVTDILENLKTFGCSATLVRRNKKK